MKKYLTSHEREKIETSLQCGKSIREIARDLKRHHSTIIKEVKVNGPCCQYRAKAAEARTKEELSKRGAKSRLEQHGELIQYVHANYKNGVNSLEEVLQNWQKSHDDVPSLATLYKWVRNESASRCDKPHAIKLRRSKWVKAQKDV